MRSTVAPHVVVRTIACLVLSAAATIASPAAAQIAPRSTLVFTGAADATELGSAGVLLEFVRPLVVDPGANTGTFASLNTAGPGATASIAPLAVGNGPQEIREFLRVGPYTFDLAHVPSGRYAQDDCYVAPAVGQRCTPYQLPSYERSPFYLENLAFGSDGLFTALVSFDVVGTVTARGMRSAFVGTLTARFDGVSYQEALAGLEQHGLRDVPFTGTFVATTAVVPEPSTTALLGGGLAALGGVLRLRRKEGLRRTTRR